MNTIPFEITLTSEERDLLKSTLNVIPYDPMGGQKYISSLRNAFNKSAPARLLSILENQRASCNPLPYMIINNSPIDDAINGSPFFEETGTSFKSGSLSENMITAVASFIGEPYSINFEGRELVNNLTPQKNTEYDYTGLGSKVELSLHTENAALKFIPEEDCSPMSMLLLGVRKELINDGPYTYVSDAREALKLLTQDDINILYEKNYIIRLPYRWRSTFKNLNTDLVPLISGSLEMPRVTVAFYPDMVLSVNEKAKKAFDNFYEAVKSVSLGIKIIPGKMVLIDNRFALHSREAFEASYDINNRPYRWVQRIFVAQNLWGFRGFKAIGDRVFGSINTI